MSVSGNQGYDNDLTFYFAHSVTLTFCGSHGRDHCGAVNFPQTTCSCRLKIYEFINLTHFGTVDIYTDWPKNKEVTCYQRAQSIALSALFEWKQVCCVHYIQHCL